MFQRALLFTGGRGPAVDFDRSQIPPCSFVCAADSGIDTAISLGYTIDEAIGDFDSISGIEILESISHTRLPAEKDLTDTEAMLIHTRKRGITEYVLIGGGEGRFDHLLHLYTLFSHYIPPIQWITAREHIYLVQDSLTLRTLAHAPLSILPAIVQGKSTVSSKQLHWELSDYPISMEQQSISNKATDTTCEITVKGDPVFVSIPFP